MDFALVELPIELYNKITPAVGAGGVTLLSYNSLRINVAQAAQHYI